MGNRKITREEIKAYNQTTNGHNKYIWMIAGVIIDIMSSFGVGALIINSYKLPGQIYFYSALFILLVIVVLGGELIGVYFGGLEQYFYDKDKKKVLNIDE